MDRVAFVFSGQGDQAPGMGQEMYEKYQVARDVFDRLENIRRGTIEQCFYSSEDLLKETINTQPCLFAYESAACAVLSSRGITPTSLAGFSLGEVVAASHSGLLSLEDGFKLVIKRATLMQKASEERECSMVAVLKLEDEKVIKLSREFENVYPVNFNCPGQVTVALERDKVEPFSQSVKIAGGRAIKLNVKGGFHSPFMKSARCEFEKVVQDIKFDELKVELYSNKSGEAYKGDMKTLLSNQIDSPVLWSKLITNMIKSGVNTFVEIGPGLTLTNMIKKIDKSVNALSYKELLC